MTIDKSEISVAGMVSCLDAFSLANKYHGVIHGDLTGENRRHIGNMPLKRAELGRFEYMDETIKSYGEYKIPCCKLMAQCLDVYVFHSAPKAYGRSGLSFSVPVELSKRLKKDRYETMWFIQVYRFGEEGTGPVHSYQKYMRKSGYFDCLPVPQILTPHMGKEVWTIAITAALEQVPAQFDGFVYPSSLNLGDLLKVIDFLNVSK